MTIDTKKISHYVLIYILIAFQGAPILNLLGTHIFFGLCIILSVAFILREKRISKNYFLYFSGLALLLFFTMVRTNAQLSVGTTLSILSRFLFVYLAVQYDKSNFLTRFLKIMYILAIISLFQFVLIELFGVSIFAPFYTKLYYNNNSYGLIFIRVVLHQLGRNSGIFGEPGQYQILLSTALYFLITGECRLEKKQKKAYFIVFLITLITAQSTAGFIAIAMIIIYVLLENKANYPKSFKVIGIIICVILGVFIAIGGDDSFIYRYFINKVFDSQGNIDLSQSSGSARTDSITEIINVIKNDPSAIWGIGYSGVEAAGVETCAGLFTLLLMIGLPAMIWLFGGMLYTLIKYRKSWLYVILTIGLIVDFTLSQPNILPIVAILMCCYQSLLNYHSTEINSTIRKD